MRPLTLEAPWQRPNVRVEKIDASTGDMATVMFSLESHCFIRVPVSPHDTLASIKQKAEFVLQEIGKRKISAPRSDPAPPTTVPNGDDYCRGLRAATLKFSAALHRADRSMNRKLLKVIDYLREPIL